MISFDWDGTLVDAQSQEWLPGAKEALRLAQRKHGAFVHSCRANYEGGLRQIRSALDSAGFKTIAVVPKPEASLYVDNQALRYEGDWESLRPHLR